MPSGCSSRETSSAPINRCTHIAARPDISSIATISVMMGTYSMKLACARIALRSCEASIVAERGAVSLAQPPDLNGEDGVEQGEEGEIG